MIDVMDKRDVGLGKRGLHGYPKSLTSKLSLKSITFLLCAAAAWPAHAAARVENSPHPDWIAEVRERIHAVFAGMEGDFHRERLEMRLEAAERLAAIPDRTPLEDAELDEFRSSFDEAFAMWERDPLNPAVKAVELNLADFMDETATAGGCGGSGAQSPSFVADAAFAAAIAAIRALDGAPVILRIPAGDYLIDTVVSGRVVPRGRFHLDLSGLTNCAVVGESPETTRIRFGVYGNCGVSIDGSENCTVAGIDFAWSKAMFSQGVIESYDPSDFSAVVRHHPETLPPTEIDPDDGHTHVCALFSPDGKFLRDCGNIFTFFAQRRAEDLGDGLFRIWFDDKPHWSQDVRNFRPRHGDVVTVTDRMNTQMTVRISGSAWCSFENVWIRNSPAGTICGTMARYLAMDHCRVFPAAPGLVLSSNADTGFTPPGTHIAHCEFSNMGDDGANFLGSGASAVRREGSRSLVIRPLLGRLRPGDFQQVVGADGRICVFRVESIRVVQEEPRQFPGLAGHTRDRWIVTYDGDLPDDIATEADCSGGKPDVVFTPLEWGTGSTMRGNFLHDFRGRGACLQSSHAIVEDNIFENMINGIEVAGRLAFREGPIASDALIRRNVFRDTRTGIHSYWLDGYGRALPEGEKTIRRLEIVSNRFERVATPFELKNIDESEIVLVGNEVSPAHATARPESSPHFDWIAEVRERIHAVFAGMEGDFHRERLEMRLEAAERLASIPERTMLLDAELDEFRAYFEEAFALWEQDPLNPAVKAVKMDLSDFISSGDAGAQPPSFVADAAFTRAIAAIRALDGVPSILRIPAGDYLICSVVTGSVLRGLCHLDFGGITNCAIVGDSPETTRIEFGVYSRNGFSLNHARNCTLANLDLSFREPPFSQVQIESYDSSSFTAIVRRHPGTLRPDDPRFLTRRKTEQVCIMFDKDGNYIRDRGIPYPFFALRAEDLGGDRFRIWFDTRRAKIADYRPIPGDVLCLVERNAHEPLHIAGSEFLNLHRIWFRNSPSGTASSRVARGFTEDHCRVFPKSPDLFLSTNADTFYSPIGSHLAHCEFERMGDDGANCLGEGYEILGRDGPRTISIAKFRGRIRSGDVHVIVHAIEGRILGEFRVASVSASDGGLGAQSASFEGAVSITYDCDLPPELTTVANVGAMEMAAHKDIAHGLRKATAAADILYAPLAFGTGFTMRDCRIHDMRGRGTVVQCPNAIIEDCVFENILGGMEIAGYTHHLEGIPPHNVAVRRNVFRDIDGGIFAYFTDVNCMVHDEEAPIRWIEISSNRFERVKTPFSLRNTAGVTMLDNVEM